MKSPPIALTIAGYDCSAGAGVLADIKVFDSIGVFGLAATTAIVAQRPGHVGLIEWLDPKIFKAQLQELSVYPISTIKIGMLGSREILNYTCEFIDQHPTLPVILDPVLKASTGRSLSKSDFTQALQSQLLNRTSLITPNRTEAEILLNRKIESIDDIRQACRELVDGHGCSVLLKGGHFETDNQAVDYLCSVESPDKLERFSAPRLEAPDLHGTGCHLSSAIAAYIALGETMPAAIAKAKEHLHQRIENYHQWPGNEGESIEAL